jgi:ribosomal protein L7/L12
MAFTISADAQAVFFQKVFGQSHPVTDLAKTLVAAGVTFEVSMYTIKASAPGKKLGQVSLTYGTTSLMKGTVSQVFMSQNKTLIESWLSEVGLKMGVVVETPNVPVPVSVPLSSEAELTLVSFPAEKKLQVIKAVMGMTEFGLLDAKNLVESVPVVVKTFPNAAQAHTESTILIDLGCSTDVVILSSKLPGMTSSTTTNQPMNQPIIIAAHSATPKPVPQVVHLKEAKALGQKVHGTSTGSVYYCIAYTDHVKVAARIMKGGSISIRAEWTDSPTAELKKLEESGVSMKPNYASVHFGAEGVPLQRVIGAFLVGTGINWKAAVMNGSDLVIGD